MPKPIKPNPIKWTKPKFKVGEKLIAVIESSYGSYAEVVFISVVEVVDLYSVGYKVKLLHVLYNDNWYFTKGREENLFYEWIEKYPLLKQNEVMSVLSRLPSTVSGSDYEKIFLSQIERIIATDETPERVVFT